MFMSLNRVLHKVYMFRGRMSHIRVSGTQESAGQPGRLEISTQAPNPKIPTMWHYIERGHRPLWSPNREQNSLPPDFPRQQEGYLPPQPSLGLQGLPTKQPSCCYQRRYQNFLKTLGSVHLAIILKFPHVCMGCDRASVSPCV